MTAPGVGPQTDERLAAVGIPDLETLERVGSVEAYVRLKRAWPEAVSLNALWGMEGRLLGISWAALPPTLKAKLRAEVEARQAAEETP